MENCNQETTTLVTLASPVLPLAVTASAAVTVSTVATTTTAAFAATSDDAVIAGATTPTKSDSNGIHENKQKLYKSHALALSERCKVIQQDNERLVHRIHQVAKQLRRLRLERRFIMDRLDRYRDNWREAPLQLDLGMELPLPEAVNSKNQIVMETPNGKKSGNIKSTEKKDPNLPKRPANPFFRFCQEQRPLVLDQIITSGEGEPTKQDLTKRLAVTWNTMEHSDKKIYYDMYEKSKEKYAADMEEYTINKSINAVQTSNFTSSQ